MFDTAAIAVESRWRPARRSRMSRSAAETTVREELAMRRDT